jgi:putative ABC transport system substrate-binding protein
VLIVGSVVALAALAACASPFAGPPRVARVGVLSAVPLAMHEAFRQGLRDLGYVEGRSLILEFRYSSGSEPSFDALAAELIALPVDVLVAGNTPAAQAASAATSTVPIVLASATDPVGQGLVESLARPGGNITGIGNFVSKLTAKRLELLQEAVPGVSQVAVLWNASNPGTQASWRDAQAGAAVLGLGLRSYELHSAADIEPAFAAAVRDGAQALMTLDDYLVNTHRQQLVDLAAESRLPAIYGVREFAHSGGLMAYGANRADLWRRAASYVDRILRGTPPGAIPFEQPSRLDLVVNLRTAQALGLNLESSLLLQADEVLR